MGMLRRQRLQDEHFLNRKLFELMSLMWELHHAANHQSEQSKKRFFISDFSVEETLECMLNMEITEDLFQNVLREKAAIAIFRDLDVSEEDQRCLFEMLD